MSPDPFAIRPAMPLEVVHGLEPGSEIGNRIAGEVENGGNAAHLGVSHPCREKRRVLAAAGRRPAQTRELADECFSSLARTLILRHLSNAPAYVFSQDHFLCRAFVRESVCVPLHLSA
jgi:hypothetical protein